MAMAAGINEEKNVIMDRDICKVYALRGMCVCL